MMCFIFLFIGDCVMQLFQSINGYKSYEAT